LADLRVSEVVRYQHAIFLVPFFVSFAACGAASTAENPTANSSTYVGVLQNAEAQCNGYCERFDFDWPAGTTVLARIQTEGFPARLEGPGATGTDIRFVSDGAPLSIVVSAPGNARGRYRLQVSPPPKHFRVPPQAPSRVVLSPEDIEPDDAIDQALANTFDRFDRGRTFYGDLAALPQMSFEASQGRCYVAALVVEEGGRIAGANRTNAPTLRMRVRRHRVAQTRVSQRVLYLEDEICVARRGQLEVLFEEEHDDGPRRAIEAGQGTFRLYLYERPRS
jgi:hypothetical protein